MPLDFGVELGLVSTVADDQKACAPIGGTAARYRRCQHVRSLPAPEGARETDDAVAVGEPQAAPEAAFFVGIRRSVGIEIRTIRVDENLSLVDSARDQLVPHLIG